jgi:hypothetical protein
MTDNDLIFLKSHIDKAPVKICFTDGEEAIVKIISVSDTEKDIIYNVVSSNRDKPTYKKGGILARFEDIKRVSATA